MTPILASNTQIIVYPPPGSSIFAFRSYILQSPTSEAVAQPELPSELKSAFALRFSVFVDEQKASVESEIDSDDPRSWHFVALVTPPGNPASSGNLGDGGTEKEHIVAATLRIVPVSSTPSVAEEAHGASPGGLAQGPSHKPTALWDGSEPYIKIGRVATLSSHRRMGFAQSLVESAVDWAGRHREILRQPNGGELTQENTERSFDNQWNGLILVHAQKAVKLFWEKLEFVEDEGMGVWWEEGLEHIGMWRRTTILG